MTLTVYDKLEQSSPEWNAARRGMVTASVVGGLLSVRTMGAMEYDCPTCDALASEPCMSLRKTKTDGPINATAASIKTMHPDRVAYANQHANSSPLIVEPANGKEAHSLTALLTAERITDFTHPSFTSDDMYRGKDYEPVAVDTYAAHYGVPVTTVGFMVLEEDGYRLGYSPDALVGEDGLLEVKAPRQKGQLVTILGDQVPADHMAQLQTGLLVSGRKWIDFVSACADMALWSKRVYPDPVWFAAIIAAAKQYQATSDAMLATYNARTEGLPVVERLPDFNEPVELKL